MQEEIQKKLAQKAMAQLDPLLAQARDSVGKYQKLQKELQDPKFLEKLKWNKNILADTVRMDSFGSSQNKFQIQNARKEVAAFDSKREELQKLAGWKDSLNKLELQQPTRQLNQDSLMEAEKRNLPDIYKWAGMVQDLQIGTCYPLVSPFTMQGIGLTGGYAEIRAGRVITAAGYGHTLTNNLSFTPEQQVKQDKDKLFISSMGYATKKGGQVLVHILKAGDLHYQVNSPWQREAIDNTVISLEARQAIKKGKGSIETEIARSSNTPQRSLNNANDILTNNELKNHAARLGGVYNFNKGKTITGIQARWVGADFFSKGTPYLRKDVTSLKANVKQYLWKKFLYVQGEVGKELTNVSQADVLKGSWTSCMLQAGFSLPGYPALMAGYIPTRQYFEYMASDSGIYSAMDMKYLQLSHVMMIAGSPISLMAMYTSSIASTINYAFLNQNISAELLAPFMTKYTLHASYLQAVTTLAQKPVSYQYMTLDISENRAKGSYCLGAQYRQAAYTTIGSIFTTYSRNFSKHIMAYIKLEMMQVERQDQFVEASPIKKSLEAGASARISYTF